jgi:4a-hydroxytetrahydrobiopterin dehydratase
MNELARRKCVPCEGGVAALSPSQVAPLLKALDGWSLDGKAIARTYSFANYYEAVAFVNAAAWISHREDHHPDMLVGYNSVRVSYHTHAIDGLSENDFICAAKLDALFAL